MLASSKLCNIEANKTEGISPCFYDMPLINISEAHVTPEMGEGKNMVLVIDNNKKPVNPCRPADARLLLKGGKAAVFRRFPFTIILNEDSLQKVRPLRLKIDPGSTTTGMALVDDKTGKVISALEISHRSKTISRSMISRASSRKSRRYRNTRYREARYNNRKTASGWLPPSFGSRIANDETWIKRFMRYSPISHISVEIAKFDTQLMQNAEISGIEYQQGALQGYEVREYLLEKFGRKCCYCGGKDRPLEIDHIVPKSRGGSNRVSNLAISCKSCNQMKSNQNAHEFGYPEVQKYAQSSLKDAAAMNITRIILLKRIETNGLPLETGTGALTKLHRMEQGLEKAHWIDAACVGISTPKKLLINDLQPLLVKATGHGSRQMCKVDKYGFPRTQSKKNKKKFGFQTGDMIKAIVKDGKKKGTHLGKVAVRSSGYFDILRPQGIVTGIKHTACRIIHKSDGYSYSYLPIIREKNRLVELMGLEPITSWMPSMRSTR